LNPNSKIECIFDFDLTRNSGKRGYRFNQADGFAQQRHQSKTKFIKLGADVKKIINRPLQYGWECLYGY
jgi:hypothetical protein